jgi:hypothetical protein
MTSLLGPEQRFDDRCKPDEVAALRGFAVQCAAY